MRLHRLLFCIAADEGRQVRAVIDGGGGADAPFGRRRREHTVAQGLRQRLRGRQRAQRHLVSQAPLQRLESGERHRPLGLAAGAVEQELHAVLVERIVVGEALHQRSDRGVVAGRVQVINPRAQCGAPARAATLALVGEELVDRGLAGQPGAVEQRAAIQRQHARPVARLRGDSEVAHVRARRPAHALRLDLQSAGQAKVARPVRQPAQVGARAVLGRLGPQPRGELVAADPVRLAGEVGEQRGRSLPRQRPTAARIDELRGTEQGQAQRERRQVGGHGRSRVGRESTKAAVRPG